MCPKEGQSSVFSGRRPLARGGREDRGDKAARSPKKDERRPARPLAELAERVAREKRGEGGQGKSLRQRLAGTLPLFGVVNLREIGLGVIIVGAVLFIWVWPHLLHWGLLITALGFVIMRYGDNWVKGN